MYFSSFRFFIFSSSHTARVGIFVNLPSELPKSLLPFLFSRLFGGRPAVCLHFYMLVEEFYTLFDMGCSFFICVIFICVILCKLFTGMRDK